MKPIEFPRFLDTSRGRMLNSGPAREAGGRLYLNPATGDTTTVFFGRITFTGPKHSWIRMAGDGTGAMPPARIDHNRISSKGPVRPSVGDRIFVGFLVYGDPTVAHLAWILHPAPERTQPPHRDLVRHTPDPTPVHRPQRLAPGVELGVIARLTPRGAIIRQGARSYMAHADQLTAVRHARVGLNVSFLPAIIAGKDAAVGVRAA